MMTRSDIRRFSFPMVACCAALFATSAQTSAAILSFGASDFGLTTTFNNVVTFDFNIEIEEAIVPGRSYSNPAIRQLDFRVSGSLPSPTPSGFSAFALERNVVGNIFYTQGSSLTFAVSATADLSDGLQINELTGLDPIFEFNAREFMVTPGRYHPPRFRLNADGTGRIENSNNQGGVNPGSGMNVNVDFGEEYITDLTFDPAQLTISAAAAIPEPSMVSACLIGAAVITARRRRRHRC